MVVSDFDKIDLHYKTKGAGSPVLMIHGGGADHRHMVAEMEPVFDRKDGWQRVYPDMPGHGQTPAPEWLATHEQILDVLLEFWDREFGGQRMTLVGMSSGGHLARGLIHKRPHLIDGVFLNAAAFEPDPTKRTPATALSILEDPGFVSQVGETMADRFRRSEPTLNKGLADWIENNFAPAQEMLNAEWAAKSWEPENYEYSFDLHPMAEPFDGPSLILCGRQDSVTGYLDGLPLLEDYPRATLAVLDGCGHLIAPVQPNLFNAIVGDWLDRVRHWQQHGKSRSV